VPQPEPQETALGSTELNDRFDVDTTELIHRLATLGWLGNGDTPEDRIADALENTTDREIRRALLGYQHFHGLEADQGTPDPETRRSLLEPRFCGLPDVMPIQLELARWADPHIVWALDINDWPKIGLQGAQQAFALAWQQWADVCGIQPEYTSDLTRANVVVRTGKIDGPQGVLAWSELPGNDQWRGTSKQMYDAAEAWANAVEPPRYQIDLVRVACHEIGHVLGLPHIAAGNLLQPTYDTRIRKPQTGDINEVVQRYGPPRKIEPTPSTGKAVISIELDGGQIVGASIPGFRVSKLSS
jgi:hypothetical protein